MNKSIWEDWLEALEIIKNEDKDLLVMNSETLLKVNDYIRLLEDKAQISTIQKLDEMASVNDPWDLFEPHLWYDKLGASL